MTSLKDRPAFIPLARMPGRLAPRLCRCRPRSRFPVKSSHRYILRKLATVVCGRGGKQKVTSFRDTHVLRGWVCVGFDPTQQMKCFEVLLVVLMKMLYPYRGSLSRTGYLQVIYCMIWSHMLALPKVEGARICSVRLKVQSRPFPSVNCAFPLFFNAHNHHCCQLAHMCPQRVAG